MKDLNVVLNIVYKEKPDISELEKLDYIKLSELSYNYIRDEILGLDLSNNMKSEVLSHFKIK